MRFIPTQVTTQRSGFICNGRLSHEFIPTTQRSGFICNGRLSHEIYYYTSNTEVRVHLQWEIES